MNSGTKKFTHTQNPIEAVDDSLTITTGTGDTINIINNDTLPSGTGTITGLSIDDPNGGTLTTSPNGEISYDVPLDATATVTVTYILEDANGDTTTAIVAFTITPPADNTVSGADDTAIATILETFNIDLLTNDTVIDGSPTVKIISQPSQGTASVNPNGTIIYVAPATTGTVTIIY